MTRVGPRLLLALLAGRGLFRLVQYTAAVVLLPIWGSEVYAQYAAATGACYWLTALSSIGPEKAALKLLARARRLRPAILATFLRAAGGLTAAALLALPVLNLAVTSAALALSFGANLLLVGLCRVLGRPRVDSVNSLVLSAAYGGLTVAAALGGLGPVGYVSGQLAVVTALNAVLLVALGRSARAAAGRPRRVLRLVAGTSILMGGGEICAHAGTSLLFVVLAIAGRSDQAGLLYLGDVAWSIAMNAFFYVLRVHQPATAVELAAGGRAAVLARALPRLRFAAVWGLAWLAVGGAALLLVDVDPVVLVAVLLATRAPAFVSVGLAGYALENATGSGLRAVAAAAAVGLGLVAVAASAAVPAHGAVGAIWALGVMDAAQAAVLVMILRRAPASRAAGSG